MSLLNQYLKSIAGENAGKISSGPLPSMLKSRRNKNGRRLYKTGLLILVSTVVMVIMVTWRYNYQVPSQPMASGVTGKVALAETNVISQDIRDTQTRGVENSPEAFSDAARSYNRDNQRVQKVSPPIVPEPSMSAPSAEMSPNSGPSIQPSDRRFDTPPLSISPAVTLSDATDRQELSAAPGENVISETPERSPGRASAFSRDSGQARRLSPPPVAVTSKKSEPEKSSAETAQSYYQLGLGAIQEKDLSLAERYFRETLKHTPQNADALLNLSNVYIRQKRFESALQALETIRQIDPDNVKALNNLGYVALQRKDFNKARHFYETALQHNPADEVSLTNLAYLAQLENNFNEALHFYESIRAINPENSNAFISAAHLMTQKGQIVQAVQLYNRSLTLKSVQNNPELAQRIKQRISVLLAYD